nr:immunoglobulin light chain junction region [Mus musculus]NSL97263.1 immunoglobulin light chain junction region [Mus musculus]NSL97395.1 immunoglobulin light chain junction region [Mus musculus]NSL97465.1 immunoglobulin light chain junction region [Mus musculus]NSL97814.1 immunoglobulin light chain junction region [Mus musculus]
CWQGTHFPYTF